MQIKDLPNILTILRIIIVPFFILAFINDYPAFCAVLFIISGLSDMLDGYVARKFLCESNLGKILDPVADKLTYATVFFCLYSVERIPLFFIVGFVIIQLLQAAGALLLYRNKKIVVKSNIPGKIAGFSMFVLCLFNLLFFNIIEDRLFINLICLFVLAIITCASAVYFMQYTGIANAEKTKRNDINRR